MSAGCTRLSGPPLRDCDSPALEIGNVFFHFFWDALEHVMEFGLFIQEMSHRWPAGPTLFGSCARATTELDFIFVLVNCNK